MDCSHGYVALVDAPVGALNLPVDKVGQVHKAGDKVSKVVVITDLRIIIIEASVVFGRGTREFVRRFQSLEED